MPDEIFPVVQELLARSLKLDVARVTPGASFGHDIVLDSLTTADLLSTLSARYHVQLDPWEISGVQTVGELCALVAGKAPLRRG